MKMEFGHVALQLEIVVNFEENRVRMIHKCGWCSHKIRYLEGGLRIKRKTQTHSSHNLFDLSRSLYFEMPQNLFGIIKMYH